MNISKFTKKIALVGVIVVGMIFVSCVSTHESKPTVAVSILPQKYLLERLVGDKYNVVSLLPQGTNPETFEPNASNLIELETSDAYFKIGNIGFENALSSRLKSNNRELAIFDNSKGIEYITDSHDLNHEEYEGDDHQHHHEIDPHVWSSVRNARIIAANMLEALKVIDFPNANVYESNYKNLMDSLSVLDEKIKCIINPMQGRKFAVWHPSLSYFARDYGLEQVSLQTAGKEESIKGLKAKFDIMTSDSIRVFLYQAEFDSRQADAIASQLSVPAVSINPMNENWAEELIHTANAIAGCK
ncbi:MAG: zinc ABC transporter substrate-binding protein [Muribaculaceae bacterium]|nr:zinc ABC transporter substrate-binding protein [Muribaculaceae bacterium]